MGRMHSGGCGQPNARLMTAIVDGTPDGGYAIRILEAYRIRCDFKHTVHESYDPSLRDYLNGLNEVQDKRAVELDKAIEVLKGAKT